MSNRPAIIALLLTLLLAIGAYFVLKPPVSAPSANGSLAVGERILSLDPAALQSIVIHNPPAQPQHILHSGASDGRWNWRATETSSHTYALDDSLMRSFLRKFAEARSIASPVDNKPLPDQPAPVKLTFHTAAGDTIVRFSPRALGGQVLADVSSPTSPTRRSVILPDELLAVLTSPGPSAWRDTRALAVDVMSAARVTYTDGKGSNGFGLAKRDGQWLVTTPAPVTAPAEAEMASAVMRTIESLTISRFFDDNTHPTVQAAGLDKPSSILTLEFDDRAIDPTTQKPTIATRTVRLRTGQPADTSGSTLYATTDEGQTIVAVDAGPLAKLLAPASSLVMRKATRTPPADVGSIEITGLENNAPKRTVKLVRDSITGRWSETLDATDSVALDPEQAAAAETILTFFTRAAADAVEFYTPPPPPAVSAPAGAKRLGIVKLNTPGGQPLDQFELLSPASGTGIAISTSGVGSASILRSYASPPQELVRRLAVLAR